MSIDDLTSMDLLPLLLIFGISTIIFLIYCYFSSYRAKTEFENLEEKTETNLKIISKDLEDGGTMNICTLIFQKEDGSRLALKTAKAEIYETIVVGDIGNVKYKNNLLTEFIHIAK